MLNKCPKTIIYDAVIEIIIHYIIILTDEKEKLPIFILASLKFHIQKIALQFMIEYSQFEQEKEYPIEIITKIIWDD